MLDIMDFFPYETPRDSQLKVLREVESNWRKAEVFVIRVPVAGGKSAIAATIQNWCISHKTGAAITVPNNMLRDQYMKEFSWMRTLKAQKDYYLPRFQCTVKRYMQVHNTRLGPKGCQYNEDKRVIRKMTTPIIMNFMGYQAHKSFRNVMIVDEAHQLLPLLQTMHARRLWKHIHRYPSHVNSVSDILMWLESMGELSPMYKKLYKDLSSLTPATTVEFGEGQYRGESRECINLLPVDVSSEPPIFWPRTTKKLVLMSATINESDIENMGLSAKKVHYIDAASEIPEERRPIYYRPVGSMSKRNKNKTMPLLVDDIMEIVSNNEGKKGFIHATYELANLLKRKIHDPRFIFHTKNTKQDQFRRFLDMPEESGAVFVGSGMAEGIDLKHEHGQYQIITKIPFKSLVNPCYRFLAENSPKDYLWLTSKDLLQASGRICRTPEDYGATYILDSDFDLWFDRAQSWGQIPEWFNPKKDLTTD